MPNNEYLVTNAELTATANSIREKLGSQAAIRWASGTGFKSSVDDIQTGGGESSDDIRFLDYDGTIVQTYSAADFANLSELPANPTHTGLTSQGWNWTLADAKTYVASYGKLDIGQMYVTDDGKTRIHIRLEEGRLDPYLGLAINGSADIDWGDGTAHSTLTGSSINTVVYTGHSYASAGEYTIAVDITGTARISGDGYGGNETSTIIRKSSSYNGQYDRVYANSIIHINIGLNVVLYSKCFINCNNLNSITIPLSVTSIGEQAFSSCYSLGSITIPSSVTTIGNNTFYYCRGLVNVSFPKDASMSTGTFYGCTNLVRAAVSPSTSSLSSVFYYCFNLISVTIPSSVTSITGNAFNNCYSLTSITIPSSVTSIDGGAFAYCYSLTSITIPSSVTKIGAQVFQNCYSLTSITIPSSVTTIGASAFSGCSALDNVIISSGVTKIGNSVFSGCSKLGSITIPSSVTSVGDTVFSNCSSLKNIVIQSNNITTTPGFSNCYSLTSITIPSSVTTISDFSQCVSLTSIVIPSNVTTIASGTFSGCSGLSFCKILKDTPPTCLGTSAWTNTSTDCQIIYPYASTIAYKSATNYPSTSTYLYLGFYAGTSGEELPTTVTDGTTTYNLTWYANTKDAVAETNPITTMQGTEVYCRSVLAA